MQTLQRRAVRRIRLALGSNRKGQVMLVCAFGLGLIVLSLQPPIVSSAHVRLWNNASVASHEIRLVLETSKTTYRIDEPVEVLAYLENLVERSFYVGNALGGFWGTSELHEIRLTIYDDKNKEVRIGRGGGSWVWKPGTTIEEKLALAYTQLRPGTVFGQKERVPIALRPGRYRLTAVYREMEALSWTEAERRRSSIPVWTQPLTSNTIEIDVFP